MYLSRWDYGNHHIRHYSASCANRLKSHRDKWTARAGFFVSGLDVARLEAVWLGDVGFGETGSCEARQGRDGIID